MKKIAFLLAIVLSSTVHGQEHTLNVKVTNDWGANKNNEPIVLNLKEIKRLKFEVNSATVRNGNITVPCQLDDMDGDSKYDELVFLTDIHAGETQKFTVTLSSATEQQQYCARVYADMMLDDRKGKHPFITSIEAPGKSYIYSDLYHHGAAFENELTAFRVYFDHRQNIDIYGKKLKRLELANTHFYTTQEQMSQNYGNDVLWAGNSIGCGSFKLWDGTSPMNWENVKTRGQKIISAGPLRSVVEVKDIDVNSDGLNVSQYYILYAGHRECEVHIKFNRPLNTERFCTGVQKVGAEPIGITRNDGIVASWGTDYPEMGKKEIFPPETVGLAVYVPKEHFDSIHTDNLNHLFILGKKGTTSIKYYISFCADKEVEGFHSSNEWFSSLDKWKEELQNPVEVKY